MMPDDWQPCPQSGVRIWVNIGQVGNSVWELADEGLPVVCPDCSLQLHATRRGRYPIHHLRIRQA